MKSVEEVLTGRHKGERIYVLGNGPSREDWTFPGDGIVVACNAAYRGIGVRIDYLVVNDSNMLEEVLLAGWEYPLLTRNDYVCRQAIKTTGARPPEQFYCGRPTFQVYSSQNSGVFATYCALVMGGDPVDLIGFDGGEANIYKGTPCYPEHRKISPSETGNRKSMLEMQRKFPDQPIRVRPPSFLSKVLPPMR